MTVHILLFLLVSWHCLRRRREATSGLLWMVLVWSVPVLGAILYLFVGIDRVRDKGFLKHQADERLLAARRAQVLRAAATTEPDEDFSRHLNRAMDSMLPNHPLMGGNRITSLVTGDEAYPAMKAAITAAEKNINLLTFIFCNDLVGRSMMDLLVEKARAGVEVRVMYDRFGSSHAFLTGFFRRYRGIPNLSVVGWTQANLLKRQFQVNLRNHRKILVIDGKQAFLGGINMHKDHITLDGKPPIRDHHFAVRGPIVQELQYAFMRDWYFMTDESPTKLLGEAFFPALGAEGSSAARIVNGGPAYEMEAIADVFFLSIVGARSQVLAVTPYFVPRRDIIQAMRSAALRGVDVRLVVPERNNHLAAGYACRALYEDLLAAGVRIFERRPPFMHTKALIVDGVFAFIGTSNIDVRSFRLDYETNLAVFDHAFADSLKSMLTEDISNSREVDLAAWSRRPASERMLENLFSLMVPVL